MDFEITHDFDAAVDEVAEALLDESYQAQLDGLGPLAERKVLSQARSDDGVVVRRTRYVLDINVSGVAKKFLGDDKPAWVEQATWSPESQSWEWSIEPEVAPELLEASGSIDLTPRGSGTTRRVEGHVKVKVPLYGGKVERWVVDGMKKVYDEEADRLTEWLRR